MVLKYLCSGQPIVLAVLREASTPFPWQREQVVYPSQTCHQKFKQGEWGREENIRAWKTAFEKKIKNNQSIHGDTYVKSNLLQEAHNLIVFNIKYLSYPTHEIWLWDHPFLETGSDKLLGVLARHRSTSKEGKILGII